MATKSCQKGIKFHSMKKYTTQDINNIKDNISELIKKRVGISNVIYKERQKLYNHRKYLKRKLQK